MNEEGSVVTIVFNTELSNNNRNELMKLLGNAITYI